MAQSLNQNLIDQSVYGYPQKRLQESEQQHKEQQDISNRSPFLSDQDEVMVRQLPERLNSNKGQTFFSEVQSLLNATQPRFVFDFAQVRELDAVGIHLLLQCLEEVMKLNGDVKLAAIPPGPAGMLERAGVDSLFEIFDSTADAVQSFYYLPLKNEEPMRVPLRANHTPINGATAGFAAD